MLDSLMRHLERVSKYAGPIFSVYRDLIELPDGQQLQRDVVEHGGSVAMLVINNDAEVKLVKQYRHAAGETLYEIPAGTLRVGENPVEAAARECEEELGLIPRPRGIQLMTHFYPSPGFLTERIYLYRINKWSQGKQALEPDEHLEVETFFLEDTLEMIIKHQIRDAKTILALLWESYV